MGINKLEKFRTIAKYSPRGRRVKLGYNFAQLSSATPRQDVVDHLQRGGMVVIDVIPTHDMIARDYDPPMTAGE